MRKPSMIYFDYGQTLIDETEFHPERGIEAVLQNAAETPPGITAKQVMGLYRRLIHDVNAPQAPGAEMQYLEVPDALLQNYLYGYFGIRLTKSAEEVTMLFEKHAHRSVPSPGIEEFLSFLYGKGIRTGVISNNAYSGKVLAELLRERIPSGRFCPVVSSCDVIFRKPHPGIFQFALRKAGLPPSEVMYCGDNPPTDARGAAACGMTPVWYRGCCRTPEDAFPDIRCRKVNSWKELAMALSD